MDFDSAEERTAEHIASHRERAETLFAAGQHAQAIHELKAILLANPDDIIAQINLGSAYDILGQLEMGLEEIDRALKLQPGEPHALFVKGRILARQGKPEVAIPYLDESFKLRSHHHGALEWRCKSHLHAGNNDECISDSSELLTLDTTDASAYLHRGWAYLNKQETRRALVDFDDAIRFRPAHSLSYTVRAQAKITAGDFEGALKDASRAIELSPSKPAIALGLWRIWKWAEKTTPHGIGSRRSAQESRPNR